MNADAPQLANPYVGPRTFTSAQRHLFFGREREARNLLARVLSERLVLFYSQSGAGKSSLINARLIPGLRDAGYAALPVVRLGGELPAGAGDVRNIFLFNLMLGLAKDDPQPARFAKLALYEFLDGLSTEDGEHYVYESTPAGPAVPGRAPDGNTMAVEPYVLIIDQFEELVTTHPDRWQERAEFFRQLDEAMRRDPNLWVVLALREDFIAPVEPYAPLLADRMRARFYMERMGLAAALEAIRRPAELGCRPFADGVAERLVEDLRQVRVPGQDATIPGQYVEPVQLQVVCQQLWENIKGRPLGLITMADLQEAGDVNRALIQFYEETLRAALTECADGVSERRMRTWFDKELITPAGTRGLVRQGEQTTGSLPNAAVGPLQKRFLVRAEARSGDTWIELVHDRFVAPILDSNRSWFARREDPLAKAAKEWDKAGRPAGRLYAGSQLASATAQLRAEPEEYGDLEQEFLEVSQKAEDRRQSGRQRWIASAAFVLALLFIILAGLAYAGMRQANSQTARVNAAAATVQAASTAESIARVTSDANAMAAAAAQGTSDANALAALAARAASDANAATAVAAQLTSDANAAAAVAARQTSEANASTAVAAQATSVANANAASTVVAGQLAVVAEQLAAQKQLEAKATAAATAAAGQAIGTTALAAPTPVAFGSLTGEESAIPTGGPMVSGGAPLPPMPQGRIVFESKRAPAGLWLMDADGSGTKSLVPAGGWQPSYAPGVNRIVYTNWPGGTPPAGLFTIATSGGRPDNLGGYGVDNWDPSYSPDGKWVAFTSSRDYGDWEIYLISTDGANRVLRLTNSPGHDEAAAFSPDGRKIAFSSERGLQAQRQKIWVMNADGTNAAPLTAGDSVDLYAAWSPDGSQIAFERTLPGGRSDIWVMNADGSNPYKVTDTPDEAETAPTWSPDGAWLAFVRTVGTGNAAQDDIFISTPDGQNAINLTDNPANDRWPAWLPTAMLEAASTARPALAPTKPSAVAAAVTPPATSTVAPTTTPTHEPTATPTATLTATPTTEPTAGTPAVPATTPTSVPTTTPVGTATPEASAPTATATVQLATPSTTPTAQIYVIKPGDTLYGLAQRYYGSGNRWGLIFAATNARAAADPTFAGIGSARALRAGQKVVIPARR